MADEFVKGLADFAYAAVIIGLARSILVIAENGMHFVDCNPYGHLVWGDGDRDLAGWIATLDKYDYQGYLGQEITDERYLLDPADADFRNFHNLERYFEEDI